MCSSFGLSCVRVCYRFVVWVYCFLVFFTFVLSVVCAVLHDVFAICCFVGSWLSVLFFFLSLLYVLGICRLLLFVFVCVFVCVLDLFCLFVCFVLGFVRVCVFLCVGFCLCLLSYVFFIDCFVGGVCSCGCYFRCCE